MKFLVCFALLAALTFGQEIYENTDRSSKCTRDSECKGAKVCISNSCALPETAASTPEITAPPVEPTSAPEDDASISAGAIVGIIIGVLALIALIAFCLWFAMKKNKNNKEEDVVEQL